jgi:ribonuclease G
VAVLEDERLVEIFWTERQDHVGKVYKAQVKDVLPGLSCAFVDIGMEKNAFLYFGDVVGGKDLPNAGLKSGQVIMVQVKKEAFSEKGARVTGFITLPGHFLVLLPFQEGLMVSRKIEDPQIRGELCELVQEHMPPGMGLIFRTACIRTEHEEIVKELKQLLSLWSGIDDSYNRRRAPCIVYEDMDVLLKTLRDYLDQDTNKVVINDIRLFERVDQYRTVMNLGLDFKLMYEAGGLFEKYGLDQEMIRSMRRKIWLKSGGYLVFDQTEAMTVIDINTGKFVGKNDFAETIFTVNAEAALEIPRQIRLRGLGGIILVDFIDMKDKVHAEKVLAIFKNELGKDKAHTKVFGFTQLGFLEMTRRKSRYGLADVFADECTHCRGYGRMANVVAHNYELKSKLINTGYLEGETIVCLAHPDVVESVEKDKADLIYISQALHKKIRLVKQPSLRRGDYRFTSE